MLKTIAVIVALVVAAFGGYLVSESLYGNGGNSTTATAKTDLPWVAAAPGRVEPGSGEFRLGAAVLGQVADVPVKVNDEVEASELLIRLDDEEARARLAAAEAEEGLRKRERDAEPTTSGRADVTKGEDGVYSSEREVMGAQFELDFALAGKRRGEATDQQLADARRRLEKAQERVERERLAYARAQAKSNLADPSRFNSALTAARANVALAGTQLDKTRIRAPKKGTVLQLNAKQGEIVSPSPDQPLVVVGDMSVVRVKAEVDDGDVAKIKVGPEGVRQVHQLSGQGVRGHGHGAGARHGDAAHQPARSAPSVRHRGARADDRARRRASQLLPGMRVDAFVRPIK